LVVVALLASGCDWPMFMHDAAHSGTSVDTSIGVTDVANGPIEAWQADLGTLGQDPFTSSPVVANGVVYIGTSDGRLMAFDATGVTSCTSASPRSCLPLWSTAMSSQAITSTPAVADGVVYIGTQLGVVEGFDAAGVTSCVGVPKECFPIWSSTNVGPITSSPVVANGVLYIGSTDDDLYAFDAAGTTACTSDCPTRSAYRTSGRVISSPAVEGTTVYVGSDDGNLYAYDADGVQGCDVERQCAPLWVGPTGGAVRSSPSVVDGRVFVGSDDATLYAFDAAGRTGCGGTPTSCAPLWTAALPAGTESSPAVSNGVVYIGSNVTATEIGVLRAFDAAGVTNCSGSPRTCQALWTSSTSSFVDQTPITVVNGVVYAVLKVALFQARAQVYAFDEAAGNGSCSGTPKLCTPIWSDEPADSGVLQSGVAVANGYIYAAGAQLHAWTKP